VIPDLIPLREKRHFFLSFPYDRPEPVLVKCSFLYINSEKRPFCHLREKRCVPILSFPPVFVPSLSR
jgi:hypothetical protein